MLHKQCDTLGQCENSVSVTLICGLVRSFRLYIFCVIMHWVGLVQNYYIVLYNVIKIPHLETVY